MNNYKTHQVYIEYTENNFIGIEYRDETTYSGTFIMNILDLPKNYKTIYSLPELKNIRKIILVSIFEYLLDNI